VKTDEKINKIVERTKNGGAEVVALLKTGSAFYAPAGSILLMVQSILKNEKRILTASVLLNGEYGIKDTFIGVPVELGKNGVEKIIEIKLSDKEKQELQKSANIVKEGIKTLIA